MTCTFVAFKKQWRSCQNFFSRQKESTVYFTILINLRFQGYRCKSGIAIFKWRVTWNYAYSSLKSQVLGFMKQFSALLSFPCTPNFFENILFFRIHINIRHIHYTDIHTYINLQIYNNICQFTGGILSHKKRLWIPYFCSLLWIHLYSNS